LATVHYRLEIDDPHTHLLGVEVRIACEEGPVELALPSWTPGSYLIREFPRNVQDFEARTAAGQPLAWRKLDKNRWQVDATPGAELIVRYRVYANELSVRTSHVDATHAHVNGASVFMFVAGREGDPVWLEVAAPAGWRVSTSMDEVGHAAFGAGNYDELVDSPLEIGTHELVEWEQQGIPHAFAIWGRAYHPHPRLVEDTRRIIDAAAAMFGGLPYDRYLFILQIVSSGRGGLEHASSTVLQMGRDCFEGEQYESLLALIAHEFFHVWNIKRIRPETLGPFDYTRENYTRNLWVSEGFTTYYTDLLLVRAGLMKPERYLERLAEAIARHEALPGRHHQSLEESSFDAWIRFYRPDAHSPNAQISYYHKGALVALLLDMEIRRASGNERSLDDLMHLLWERYGARDVGFPEDPAAGIRSLAEEVLGSPLEDFFRRYVHATEELDFTPALAVAGVERVGGSPAGAEQPASASGSPATRPSDAAVLEARLGIRTAAAGAAARVTFVLQGTPAHAAGVNAGDEIIAIDGLRASAGDLATRIRHHPSGEPVTLVVFRRDELLSIAIELGPPPAPRLRLVPVAEPDADQSRVYQSWLGSELLPSLEG
jgi:predicted metalloprotease with PDZ domain